MPELRCAGYPNRSHSPEAVSYIPRMDAAVAGIIGALGGGLVGAAGAWVAARITSRSGYEQKFLDIRYKCYVDFLDSVVDVLGFLEEASRADSVDVRESALAEAKREARNTGRALWRMKGEAPDSIVRDALQLEGALRNALSEARSWPVPNPAWSQSDLNERISHYNALCRAALRKPNAV